MHQLDTENVEPLYFGDRRICSLGARIQQVIDETVESQDIPASTVIGILEIIKVRLIDNSLEID